MFFLDMFLHKTLLIYYRIKRKVESNGAAAAAAAGGKKAKTKETKEEKALRVSLMYMIYSCYRGHCVALNSTIHTYVNTYTCIHASIHTYTT